MESDTAADSSSGNRRASSQNCIVQVNITEVEMCNGSSGPNFVLNSLLSHQTLQTLPSSVAASQSFLWPSLHFPESLLEETALRHLKPVARDEGQTKPVLSSYYPVTCFRDRQKQNFLRVFQGLSLQLPKTNRLLLGLESFWIPSGGCSAPLIVHKQPLKRLSYGKSA